MHSACQGGSDLGQNDVICVRLDRIMAPQRILRVKAELLAKPLPGPPGFLFLVIGLIIRWLLADYDWTYLRNNLILSAFIVINNRCIFRSYREE